MAYTISEIASILAYPLAENNQEIIYLAIDSRKITDAPHTLFFALSGPRRNGHHYISELYKKGVRNFVVAKSFDASPYPNAIFIKVEDSLLALQKIAAAHRSVFHYDVVGITGSNGKTIVKEWLYQLLHQEKTIVRSPKSYNSQIGVPLSVWEMSDAYNLAMIEAGISKPDEMERLEKIIRPTMGILTNIGTAHNEGFASIEQKIEEKLILFKHCKVIIANGDHELVHYKLSRYQGKKFFWGTNKNNDVIVEKVLTNSDSTEIHVSYRQKSYSFYIPFTDSASVENAITCATFLLAAAMDTPPIFERMKRLHTVNMRLEYKKGINNCIIINDSYSADVNSLAIALDFLEQQSKQHRKTVILSDFVEAKTSAPLLYHEIIELLKIHKVSRLIGIGNELQKIIPELIASEFECQLFGSTEDFIKNFHTSSFKDEAILIKGARSYQLERIVPLLEQKAHQTVLEINVDAIAHNLKYYQQQLLSNTKIMVMVKAFAYGSGGADVANVLQYHKADYLGVAYADEGVELRNAGITMPIMVMNPESSTYDAIVDNNLEPDLYSFESLTSFLGYLELIGAKNYPVHIEMETGMNRLGFNVADTEKLGYLLRNNPYLKIQSVFSHLVGSEDPHEDWFSLQQYDSLLSATQKLESIIGYSFLKHIANSAAITRLPQLQMDMVRLGIGLYGISTPPNESLLPVATLKSTIAQIKHLKNGETVSYNRKGKITKDAVIATVRIGYADGYSRKLGNGRGYMLVKGIHAPIVGTICMDMTMIDITDIPEIKEGDEVIVFGKDLPITNIAQWAETIPYEIMTGISQRVKRVYFGEG